MRYYLSVLWHWIYMFCYYVLVTLGWALEAVLIFLVFMLGALTLWGRL